MTSNLKIDLQDLEDRQLEMRVEVPSERTQRALRAAARRLSRHTNIPGFRPGKAPYEIIERRLGQEAILDEALDDLGQEVYRQALDESELEPFAPGALEEVVSREPLVLRYTVPLAPDIDLGDYQDLRLEYQAPEVADEAVEETLEDLRQRRALIEPVDRSAQLSDVIVIDVKASLLEHESDAESDDDELILDEKGINLLIEEGGDYPFPGVHEHLIGMSAEDEKSVQYTFDEAYPAESLRQKSATFEFKCLEVKSRIVPEWSDSLAQDLGEYDDLLALRIDIRQRLQKQSDNQAESEFTEKVLDEVMEIVTVSYPPILLSNEVDDLLQDLKLRLSSQNLKLQDYLTLEGKTEQELRAELEPRARERLKRGLVLGRLVDQEGLEIEEEQIDAQIDRMASMLEDESGIYRKTFDTPAGRRRIELDLLTDRAIQHLVAIARGELIEQKGAQAETEASSSSELETDQAESETSAPVDEATLESELEAEPTPSETVQADEGLDPKEDPQIVETEE